METLRNSNAVKFILLMCATIMGSALMVSNVCPGPIDSIFPGWRDIESYCYYYSGSLDRLVNEIIVTTPDGYPSTFEVIDIGSIQIEAIDLEVINSPYVTDTVSEVILKILFMPLIGFFLALFLYAVFQRVSRSELHKLDEGEHED